MASLKLRNIVLYWGPVFLYSVLIFWMSSLSSLPQSSVSDKILHAIEYFCFALLLWWALAQGRFQATKIRLAMTVLLISSAYAASDEIHQSFVPGRYASIYDWFADVAGILGMITLMISRVQWRDKTSKVYEKN